MLVVHFESDYLRFWMNKIRYKIISFKMQIQSTVNAFVCRQSARYLIFLYLFEVLCYRSPINVTSSWIKTRTMLLLSIRLSWMLLSVPLYQAYSHLLHKIHQKLQSLYQSVPNLRSLTFLHLSAHHYSCIL